MTLPPIDWADVLKAVIVAILLFTGAGIRKALVAARTEWRARKAMWAARDLRDDSTALLVGELAKDVADIKHEVRFNGGNSLKDEVSALRREFSVSEAARRMGQGLATWEGMALRDGTIIPVHISPEWLRLTGMARDDTANGGWLRALSDDDRARVSEIVADAEAHHKVFAVEYELRNVHPPYERSRVRHTGIPVLNQRRAIDGWVWELRELPPRERRGAPDLPPVDE